MPKKTASKPAGKTTTPAASKAAGKPAAKTAPKPASKAAPKAAAKPPAVAAAKAPAKASSKPAAEKTAKAGTKPVEKPAAKPAAKAAEKAPAKAAVSEAKKVPAAKAESKPAGKVETKSEPKAGAKTDSKAPTKQDAKAPAKAEGKPEAKADAKADPKAGAKSPAKAPKAESKPEAKSAAAQSGGTSEKKGDAPAATPDADDKTGKKGITVVTPKPLSKPPAKRSGKTLEPYKNPIPSLLSGGGMPRRPLIASGPKNKLPDQLTPIEDSSKLKSPFGKKDLATFKEILLAKRAQLLGDMTRIENEALRSGSGGLSNLPQHLAEQGSDTSDQSLSLGLAETDRKLIKEIDAALDRIEAGTFGCCELTGKAISRERLEELPWARYSIEAARQMERPNFIGPRG